ncbi:hypothetical protein SNE40_020888 [Patella caerulea]|uniref:HAT C-terminal dimerisation domain-containing protein n=1 Tax=Patella caerulea TaxID=87958 RepID=A0AAN8IXM2_PATCE
MEALSGKSDSQRSLVSGHFGSRPSSSCKTPNVMSLFRNKLSSNSTRAKSITAGVTEFIIKDLRPFCVVENAGFRNLLTILEPNYVLPSRQHFSEKKIPELYEEVKRKVLYDINNKQLSLTTDGWTSRATESYVTITSCHIDENWEIKNYVLQTRSMPQSHTGSNLAALLVEAAQEWGIHNKPAVVTDNAANMVVAVKEFAAFHVGCFAHTLNLACGRALKISSVSLLLARIRRIVNYFHRSTVAAAVFKEVQERQQLPKHKLVIDVQTRWNSALDMTSRFLEQQPAVYAALTSKELRGKEKDISTLSESDIASAEELVSVLSPLKIATTALCDENTPTLSIIMPLMDRLLNEIMSPKEGDTNLIKQMKLAVVNDLSNIYKNIKSELLIATVLDPRFKSLPFLSEEETMEVFYNLSLKVVNIAQENNVSVSFNTDTPSPAKISKQNDNDNDNNNDPILDKSDESDDSHVPDNNNSAMSSLFGDKYKKQVVPSYSTHQACENEISSYKKEPAIDANSNPLHWWKSLENKFPLLSLVAKKYLGIPATSVPSERVFSTAGDIITAQRSALKPKHVDKLIFLKKNWKPKC